MSKKKNNNEALYYSALDLAIILSGFQLDCCGEAALMERIWEKERPFFQERYRTNKHQLILDVLYWEHYLYNKDAIDKEFPIVKKDVLENGGSLLGAEDTVGFSDFNRFFKNARIRILYDSGNSYVRVKRRILLEHYNFKRMSAPLRNQIQKCILCCVGSKFLPCWFLAAASFLQFCQPVRPQTVKFFIAISYIPAIAEILTANLIHLTEISLRHHSRLLIQAVIIAQNHTLKNLVKLFSIVVFKFDLCSEERLQTWIGINKVALRISSKERASA